ncbi:MAG TPA: GGDEF domain-containing protein [Alphaproteobacteria bacterium]|nr:GGDEF domain-containing protein [Alphaproteobacteria bacterium]
MRIEDKGPARGARRPGAAAAVGPTAPAGPSATTAPGTSVADVASVAGIPEAEFTPRVRQAITALMAEVDRLRQELGQAKDRIDYLERLADQDALVPVVNRRAFVRELSRAMSYARRYQVSSSVLYFDINNMKAINDSLGHAAGDAAITHVAEILVANVRESDVVGRLGGDEFGVILVHSDEEIAADKAEKLAAAIAAKPLECQGRSIAVEVAFGSAPLGGEDDPNRALDAADRAMYARKRQGGDGSPR